MIRVNLIGKSNGVGLSRDLDILATALRQCGCDVTVTPVGSKESRRRRSMLGKLLRRFGIGIRKSSSVYDINVMLEHVWSQFLADARLNVVVPNPEFFDRHDVAALPHVDRVWAKTVNTRNIFTRHGSAVTLLGFDSEDRFDANCRRDRTFFHLAGSSLLKGSARLLELWLQHPQWPELVVVGRVTTTGAGAANIRLHGGYLDDQALKQLQNSSLIHLCMSEAEGWGHSLVEAMSSGAVVISVDAPPMNELVTAERGVLIPFCDTGRQALAIRYLFDPDELAKAIEAINAMSTPQLVELGQHARTWYVENHTEFCSRVRRALGELDV